MATLWTPGVCTCEYIIDSKTAAFIAQAKVCDAHRLLQPKEGHDAALAEGSVMSNACVEAQKLYPEIKDPTASPRVEDLSDATLDAKKCTIGFDAQRKFVMILTLEAQKKTDIQSTIDAKVGAGKVIIQ